METRNLILAAAIFTCLATNATAIDYLERFHGLDQSLICLIVLFVPGVMVLFFLAAGILYITGEEGNRVLAKTLIKNGVIGFLLVVIFVITAIALLPTLSITSCIGG